MRFRGLPQSSPGVLAELSVVSVYSELNFLDNYIEDLSFMANGAHIAGPTVDLNANFESTPSFEVQV